MTYCAKNLHFAVLYSLYLEHLQYGLYLMKWKKKCLPVGSMNSFAAVDFYLNLME
jgi:hypothetical protein